MNIQIHFFFLRFFNYQSDLQYSKAVSVYTNLINPSQLPQPPVHWQPTNRNCK